MGEREGRKTPQIPMKVYLCGPMRNIEKFNFPAFEAAEQYLLSQGIDVISPHSMDINNGFDPLNGDTEPPAVEDCARRDIDAIFEVDALVLLPGWRNSRGATAEKALADWIEKPCFEYPSLTPLESPE